MTSSDRTETRERRLQALEKIRQDLHIGEIPYPGNVVAEVLRDLLDVLIAERTDDADA
jgi:hypothetical protein